MTTKKYDEIGSKTDDMIARILALHDLRQSGDLKTGYGEKAVLLDVLGCTINTLNRSLAALEDATGDAQQLAARVRSAQAGQK